MTKRIGDEPNPKPKRFPYQFNATADECRIICDAELIQDRAAYDRARAKDPKGTRLVLKRHLQRQRRLTQTTYKTIGVIFDKQAADAIAALAEQTSITQSELIRRAVNAYFVAMGKRTIEYVPAKPAKARR